MSARMLCLMFISMLSLSMSGLSLAIGAEKAHSLIREQKPELLGNGKELVSLYYFGQSQVAGSGIEQSVVGLERIGDDYLPIRWLLVFENETLLGWYYPSDVFPKQIAAGKLIFPKGTGISNVNLLPKPPMVMNIKEKQIPFNLPDSPVFSD